MEVTKQTEKCNLTEYKNYATKVLDITFDDISYTVGKGKYRTIFLKGHSTKRKSVLNCQSKPDTTRYQLAVEIKNS